MGTKDYLDSLLLGRWEKIVVQGGVIKHAPCNLGYLLSGIWIYVKFKWIGVTSAEVDANSYCLAIYILDTPPIPEPSKFNMPPRKLLENVPDDCRLDQLQTSGAKKVEAWNIEMYDDELRCTSPIIIESASGERFEITASTHYPENIEIVMVN